MFKLTDILREYRSVQGMEQIKKAKENKEEIYVMWRDGEIFVEPMDNITMRSILAFKLNFKKRLISILMLDDISDFKYLVNIQQAVKDFLRLDIIDDWWDINIGGNQDVSVTNIGGWRVKNFLKYDTSFTKDIKVAFHGTCNYYQDEIEQFGLQPRDQSFSPTNHPKGYTWKSRYNVFLTIDFALAVEYAKVATMKVNEDWNDDYYEPIVVELRNLPIENVVADDDIKTNMGYSQLLQMLYTGKKRTDYIGGLRTAAQFAYNGRIPPKFIHKIYYDLDDYV